MMDLVRSSSFPCQVLRWPTCVCVVAAWSSVLCARAESGSNFRSCPVLPNGLIQRLFSSLRTSCLDSEIFVARATIYYAVLQLLLQVCRLVCVCINIENLCMHVYSPHEEVCGRAKASTRAPSRATKYCALEPRLQKHTIEELRGPAAVVTVGWLAIGRDER